MYPLNLTFKVGDVCGFAVANDEQEHSALSDAGYEPKFVAPDADIGESDGQGHTVESVRAALDAAGIAYDKRLKLSNLIALLPA